MNSSDLDAALESAVIAVRGAARLIRRHRHDPPPAIAKHDGSTATDVDILSEQHIRDTLRARHPDHAVVGEEGAYDPADSGWIWYVDPLDGTRAFSAGQDNFSVSATLCREGSPVLTAVGSPLSGELFTARRGGPSRVNGRPMKVCTARGLSKAESLLYYDRPEPPLATITGAAARGELGRLTILHGSFILNACRAARGAHDVFLCVKRNAGALMPWDLTPAVLLVEGAGGVISDLEGRPIGGLVPVREVVAGAPGAVADIMSRFGVNVRSSHPEHGWARRNEDVFSRLLGKVAGRGGIVTIGIAGAGGGIAKTSLARELAGLLDSRHHCVISLDDYLISRRERDELGIGAHNPVASDLERAAGDLESLKSGRPCEKPVYDHVAGKAVETERVVAHRFVIVEGVMAVHPRLRPLMDLAIFIDAPAAVRFRRVARDMNEKGLTESYARAVHTRFEADVREHLMPLRASADVVIAVDQEFRLTWVSPA